MTRFSLLALALLATFVVQGANHISHTGVGDRELAHNSPVPGGLEAGYDPSSTGYVANAGSREPITVVAATTNPSSLPAAALPSTGAPVSEPAISWTGEARYCKPTPTHCQDWGDGALVAGLYSFTFGDEPYWVRVKHAGNVVDVLVVSHCACFHRTDRIDLSPAAFARLGPLSRGVLTVTVTDLREVTARPLPATDTPDQHPDDPPSHPDDDRMDVQGVGVSHDQPPEVINVQGIDFKEGVPLPEQRVITETGVYERTYFDRTIDGVAAWRYEWRGWTGKPDETP